ncbi:hypothetical protein DICPUDRAFT_39931 [Dictyostelium purpureum]|uniref:Ribosomal protein L7Ae/L30e/S12e/Gadd45 domain-containing protein n=1 Tax=Dictyostelium purpureum TaxID=5786 RepID=F0ZX97_DICPU|nr:uncharacterized protein DICPUDRAFT_39931 [Dictyostelium purpureum]EGC31435.1 hypothetical protein DICPUDRAFT_39931 [Dictyostelium purpureum]|eukprot:XP_003292034.1 hypothetical protein DICPUDRAFT_39931 [Dictyostelium purpureum]
MSEPNKPAQFTPKKLNKPDSVIGKKKKPIVFKDTVGSPYANKTLKTISNECTERILDLLNEIMKNDLENINKLRLLKKQKYFALKKEKTQLNKIIKRLKSINKKKEFVKNDKKLSKDEKAKELARQDQLEKDFQKQKEEQELKFNNLDKSESEKLEKEKGNIKVGSNDNLNNFWIGVNKITKELEKIPIHSPPSIRLILVCPNSGIQILTSHLPIMAYMRRIPICLLPEEYSIKFSQSMGIPNTGLAIAVKEKTNQDINDDNTFNEKFEEFVRVSIEASKSVNSLDFPWLPEKYTMSNLTEQVKVEYIPTNIIKGNKRLKTN